MFIKQDGHLATCRLFTTLIFIPAMFLFVSLYFIGCCDSTWDKSIVKLLRITSENNLPTWFSSVQFLMVGIFAWLIGKEYKLEKATWKKIAWFSIAVFFVYLAMDDGSRFHERVASAAARWIENWEGDGYLVALVKANPSYNWQLLMLPFFAAFGVFMTVFLWNNFYKRSLFLLFIIGIGYFVLAIAMDFVDGLDNGYEWFLDNTDYSFKQLQFASRSIEEFIEMVGTTFILVAVLKQWTYLLRKKQDKTITS